MSWASSRPPGTQAKYRTREHRQYRASLVARLRIEGYLLCTADVCLFETREITEPNGRRDDGLHAGHEDDGITYSGPQHRACNVRDGAVRGNARSKRPSRWAL